MKSYDVFESINYLYIVFIIENGIEYNKYVYLLEDDVFMVNILFCMDVCFFKFYLGFKLEMFDVLKGMYKGIVIESYGSGGVLFEGRDIFVKVNEMIESGIVVVIMI